MFINNQLAVDVGGVHNAIDRTLDLDTLGLTAGEDYDFDLYFAERHTSDSNFLVEVNFNVVPEPGCCGMLAMGLLIVCKTVRRRAGGR